MFTTCSSLDISFIVRPIHSLNHALVFFVFFKTRPLTICPVNLACSDHLSNCDRF